MIKAAKGSRSTLERERAEEKLREMIVNLELAPGAVVTQAELAERLGCGRMPLREALQRLGQEGLVAFAQSRGVCIAPLSVEDLAPVLELHIPIEALAARLAAGRMTEAQRQQLQGIVAEAELAAQSADFASLVRLDIAFHSAIALATGNRYLVEADRRLHEVSARFSSLGFKRQGIRVTSLDEHRQIIAALATSDAAVAERAMTEHYLKARERIVAALGLQV